MIAAASLALVVLVSAPLAAATPGPPLAAGAVPAAGLAPRSTASSGGLSVSLTAAPSRATVGEVVVFTVRAADRHATGALAYRIAYGDGSIGQILVPQFCIAAPGKPATSTWRLRHRYAAAGVYNVSVTVRVNCTTGQATARLRLPVTG